MGVRLIVVTRARGVPAGTLGQITLAWYSIRCSGWSYAHWRNVLFPASGTTASWLSVYAESFDTVEINATFYRSPRAEVVARWAASTPETFCFAVKASRYLTHVKRLREAGDGVARIGRASRSRTPVHFGRLWEPISSSPD